jgi:hypothetical protein
MLARAAVVNCSKNESTPNPTTEQWCAKHAIAGKKRG